MGEFFVLFQNADILKSGIFFCGVDFTFDIKANSIRERIARNVTVLKYASLFKKYPKINLKVMYYKEYGEK